MTLLEFTKKFILLLQCEIFTITCARANKQESFKLSMYELKMVSFPGVLTQRKSIMLSVQKQSQKVTDLSRNSTIETDLKKFCSELVL